MIFGSNQKLLMARAGAVPVGGIRYVGGKSIGVNRGTSSVDVSLGSLTGGLSSSAADDDVCVVYFIGASVGANANLALSYANGFTTEANLYANDSYDTNLLVGYLIYSSTSGGDTLTLPNGTGGAFVAGLIILQVWRGVDTTTPIDVPTQGVATLNTSLVNPPAITPVTSGALIIAGGGTSAGNPDTYLSSDLNNFISSSHTSSGIAIGGVGSSYWTSGSFDPSQFTGIPTSTTQGNCSATLALRPAP
jgi:hypothetical protein